MRRMWHGALVSVGATTAALVVITAWGLGVQEFILAKVRHEVEARQAAVETVQDFHKKYGRKNELE